MRKPKTIAILLLFAVLLAPAAGAYEADLPDEFDIFTQGESQVAASAAAEQPTLSLDAAAVILVESSTGAVLYEKNADDVRAVASITKIMTMILVMEAVESGAIALDDPVVCSEHAYSMGGSQIWLEPGEIMSVDELLRAVAVASANDAAVLLAEYVAGSEEEFVSRMNRRAAELGMENTTFKNACGLDEEGHLSTARDVAIMSREMLKHELVREYVTIWMDSLRGGETELVNTNKLLKTYEGITGLKTGTTGKAGICISASALRDGMEIVAVVLGSSNSTSRFDAAKTLLNYGFANYELATVYVPEEALTRVDVKLGEQEALAYSYDMPESIVVRKGERDSVHCEVAIDPAVSAPVERGQIVGEITVYANSEPIGKYAVTASEAVGRITFGSGIKKMFASLCTM